MIACLTIDVEPDCPPYLTTWRGIDEGMPLVLEFLARAGLRATFFVTGSVVRRSPAVVEAIAGSGHELGCHGDTHRRFDAMAEPEADAEIGASSGLLRRYAPVTSFRAPNLKMPRTFLPLLERHGFTVDSSEGRHKWPGVSVHRAGALWRIPASVTSSTLRWPRVARDPLLRRLRSPAVLFVHPWEFVDLTRERLRFDCRVRTGPGAIECLRGSIATLAARGARFMTLRELAASLEAGAGRGVRPPSR